MAEIETLDAPGHNLKRTLKDLFAGAAGGIAQVFTGMLSSVIVVVLVVVLSSSGERVV